MALVPFFGRQCYDKPLSEWQHWVCPHLRAVVAAPGAGGAAEVVKLLLSGDKSGEIFVFIRGPVPSFASNAASGELAFSNAAITCDKCWSSVHSINAL
jgi:hypothetical protein